MKVLDVLNIIGKSDPAPWSHWEEGIDGGIVSYTDNGQRRAFVFGGEYCEGKVEKDDPNARFTIMARSLLPDLMDYMIKHAPMTLERILQRHQAP